MTTNTFEITCGRMAVSDPCYQYGIWCSGELENVENGAWVADVDRLSHEQTGWGERISALIVRRETLTMEDLDDLEWEMLEADIGVDSGQAGFYDADFFKDTPRGEYGQEGGFYNTVCDTTYDEEAERGGPGFGTVMNRCAVSRSGYGDGGYICEYATDPATGKVVAAQIVFIEKEEDEDEEEDADADAA